MSTSDSELDAITACMAACVTEMSKVLAMLKISEKVIGPTGICFANSVPGISSSLANSFASDSCC